MQRPGLTFLHGFMGHSSDWDHVRASLPEYETSALEIQPASDWRSSVDRLAASMPDRSVVIGYSMGARLALAVALEHSHKCAGLVFVSGNPGLETDAARDQRWSADQRVAEELEQLDVESSTPFLQRWYEADVFASVPRKIREGQIARKSQLFSPEWSQVQRTLSVARQPNYWPHLNQLTMPLAVVAGELDEKYRAIADRFEAQVGCDRVSKQIVPDCGHIVHHEQPGVLLQVIRSLADRA